MPPDSVQTGGGDSQPGSRPCHDAGLEVPAPRHSLSHTENFARRRRQKRRQVVLPVIFLSGCSLDFLFHNGQSECQGSLESRARKG